MKILIIGAQGMLGTALREVFPEATAWGLDDIDITQREATREKICSLGASDSEDPLVIINAAAYTNVDGAQEEQQLAFQVNEVGVRNIAEAAKVIDATVVHYSTDYVFPGDNEDGYSEDAVPGPAVNVYGESKLAGEHELSKSGVRYFLIRTSWLYGPNGKNFIDTMLRLAALRDNLNVVNDQHGSPTYTRDLAQATVDLLRGEYQPGTYHLVNSGQTTWYDFAQQIFSLAGKQINVTPITTEHYPLPARRPRWSVLRNTKGPTLRPWQDAVAEYLESSKFKVQN